MGGVKHEIRKETAAEERRRGQEGKEKRDKG